MTQQASQTIEDILDQISSAISNLDSIRVKVTNAETRWAITSQMQALTKWWRRIEAIEYNQVSQDVKDAADKLRKVTNDIKKERKKLQNVEKVIGYAARAIAVAEKIAKMVA